MGDQMRGDGKRAMSKEQGKSLNGRVNFEGGNGDELFLNALGSTLIDARNGLYDPSGDPWKWRRRGPSARR